MALPTWLLSFGFVAVVLSALGLMAYLAWRGNKPSDFFAEVVHGLYALELSYADIDAYYDLKESLQSKYAPESLEQEPPEKSEEAAEQQQREPWSAKVPQEKRVDLQKALMRRLVACIGRLDQVQKDRQGNWKLWQSKLVSEKFWSSFCDAERIVSEEIECCVAEAEELMPGWKEHVFAQAVQLYKASLQQEAEKKDKKKAVVAEKKAKVQEVKREDLKRRQEIEDKVKQEKAAQKAMEKLLREEEQLTSRKKGNKDKAQTPAAPKSKGKKK